MKLSKIVFSLTAAFGLLAAPALADTSIAGGAFAGSHDVTSPNSAGAIITQSANVQPFATTGIVPQVSAALPISGGSRYALTGELQSRGDLGLGFGAGVGRLRSDGKVGMVYDFIAAAKVAPRTNLEARFYTGQKDQVGTAAFVGLRLTL